MPPPTRKVLVEPLPVATPVCAKFVVATSARLHEETKLNAVSSFAVWLIENVVLAGVPEVSDPASSAPGPRYLK